jgi:hypothetical protein
MVVLAYTPDLSQILAQIQVNADFLPSLQNGKYFDPISNINANITSVGGNPTLPYWIDWDLTYYTYATAKNGPMLQSPLQKTYQGIVAFLSGGSVVDEAYVNYSCQRFGFRGFWNLLPASNYPTEPTSPVAGEVSSILSSLTNTSRPSDSFVFYPQYVNPTEVDFFFSFRATLIAPSDSFVLSDYPNTIE